MRRKAIVRGASSIVILTALTATGSAQPWYRPAENEHWKPEAPKTKDTRILSVQAVLLSHGTNAAGVSSSETTYRLRIDGTGRGSTVDADGNTVPSGTISGGLFVGMATLGGVSTVGADRFFEIGGTLLTQQGSQLHASSAGRLWLLAPSFGARLLINATTIGGGIEVAPTGVRFCRCAGAAGGLFAEMRGVLTGTWATYVDDDASLPDPPVYSPGFGFGITFAGGIAW